MIDDAKTCWNGKSTRQEKPWGHELIWATIRGISAKILFMNKGESTSLKYYKHKNEVLLVRKGRIRVAWADENYHDNKFPSDIQITLLKEGDVFCIQSFCPYRITALEDAEVFEIGDAQNSERVLLFDEEQIKEFNDNNFEKEEV